MKGFTLIEVVIAVMLLAVILWGGTSLFFQSLRSSGLSDVNSNLDNSLQTILSSIEKDIRYGEVTGAGIGVRSDCLNAGETGYSGNSLYVSDLNGSETVYSLIDSKIASTSSETGRTINLNSTDIVITSLQFTWYCRNNISDKINIAIDGNSNVLSTGILVERSLSTEINLLNSGLN